MCETGDRSCIIEERRRKKEVGRRKKEERGASRFCKYPNKCKIVKINASKKVEKKSHDP
jgi:hypothetical protein